MDKINYIVMFDNGFYYSESDEVKMVYNLQKAKFYEYQWEIENDKKLKKYLLNIGLRYKVKKLKINITLID